MISALYSGLLMNRNGQGDLFNLRRDIHRLEKGLANEQPRSVFAESFIRETIDRLARVKRSAEPEGNTIAWAEAVLNQYFGMCQDTEIVREARVRYQSLVPENAQPTWCPYLEQDRPSLDVGFDALYQLALRRRSVRYYIDKTVEFDVVEKAMRVAALCPSACNRQSFRFLFYNDKHIVRDISQMPGGFAGCQVPSIVVVVGSYRGYFDERDVLVPIIDASLAAMAFLFALETLGLSSVCMNWPALPDRDEAIRRLIHLEDDEFVAMLIGVGYPDPEGKIPYSGKRDINRLVLCNEELRHDSRDPGLAEN